MGVPIYCCSRNKKEDDLCEEPSIIIGDRTENKINLGLSNTKTNNSGTINFSKKNSIKKKKELNYNTKNKQSKGNAFKDSNLLKKCTYDGKVLKKVNNPKAMYKYSGTLFTPALNRISHIIDINSIIENKKEELKEKEDKKKDNSSKDILNNGHESNAKITNLIENRRKSIIKIINFENVNDINIKEKLVDNNLLNIIDNVSFNKEGNRQNENNININLEEIKEDDGEDKKEEKEIIEELKSNINIIKNFLRTKQ